MENIDLVETSEYKKAKKLMGEENLREFVRQSDSELSDVITKNSVHIQEATAKTKSTPAYVKAVEVKKDFDKALAEDVKPYKAAIELATLILRMKKNESR